jgi:hypothetical protein
MKPEYSPVWTPEYPLGYNANRTSPDIDFYISWQQLAEITRTNIFIATDGRRFELPTDKADKPLITYKGNYGNRRTKDNLKERNPYVGIDIDIDEVASGVNKKTITEEQRAKATDDLKVLVTLLTDGRRDLFFSKLSSSGCGLHIVLNLVDIPADSSIELYEKNIFLAVQEQLEDAEVKKLLTYRYNVDMAMLSAAQALHINHDPDVIFNPNKTYAAKLYPLKPEYGEGKVSEDEKVFPVRDANKYDRKMFQRFERFIVENKVRMHYPQIMRLAIIFFQLWPEATLQDFCNHFNNFNEERAKVKHENKLTFLKGLYFSAKRNAARNYDGKKITISSLYYIMGEHNYSYTPELDIHFTGYLSTIEQQLYTVFEEQNNILIEAPTGSGKTYTLFKYLKTLARKYPKLKFVIALPYTGMAEQFAAEQSDDEFKVQVLHGNNKNPYAAYTPLPSLKKDFVAKRKTDETIHEVFSWDGSGLLTDNVRVLKKPAYRTSSFYNKPKIVRKKKCKEIQIETLFEVEKPKQVYYNLYTTTYDSAAQIKNIHTLIIDEAHDLVNQIGFRQEALKELDCVPCQKKILVTATPDALLPEVEDFYHIRCLKDDITKLPLSIIKVKGSITDALKDSIRETKSSVSFINNKPYCNFVQESLALENIKINLYNADTKKTAHSLKLQNESLITDNALCTSYCLEGFNILNPEVERINLCGEYDINKIRQGSARTRRCAPEVRLFIKDTKYTPYDRWQFNRAYEFAKEVSRLQLIVDQLNDIGNTLSADSNQNLFNAFAEDMVYIYKYMDTNSFPEGGCVFPYILDIAAIKAQIHLRYMYFLYHKQRDKWFAELGKYFAVSEPVIKENDAEDPKIAANNFMAFINAGHELIWKFEHYRLNHKKNKKLAFDAEMSAFASENSGLQFKTVWKKWTDRYYKMYEYGKVDFDIIKSPLSFFYWQLQADFAVSVIEGGKTAKEIYTSKRNRMVVDFLMSVDLKAKDYTTDDLFIALNRYLLDSKLKPYKKQKQFFTSIKYILQIKTKQLSKTSTRLVTHLIDVREKAPFNTAAKRKEIKDKLSGNNYAFL